MKPSLEKELFDALRILANPSNQVEETRGGYFYFRLNRNDVLQINAALERATAKYPARPPRIGDMTA